VVVAEIRATLPAEARAESVPQGSLLGTEPSAMWLAPRLRLRPDGEGLAFSGTSGRVALYRLDGSAGDVDVERLVDALPDGDGRAWLLDAGALRRDGESVDGPGWERLLADAEATYAVARRPATVVARVDPPGSSREIGPPGLDPVMDAAGRVAWVDADRCWNVLAPGEEQPSRALLGPGADGVPIGLDDAGRGYLARATGVTVVEPDGALAWSFGADGIVPAPGGGVIVAHDIGDALDLGDRHLPLPDVGRPVAWRLIAAGEGFLAWGGEGARGPGVLATLDGSGTLERLDDPAPADARLRGWWPAAAREWQVEGEGRVNLAVAGPENVIVVRISAG
jgi:hypothetical protein